MTVRQHPAWRAERPWLADTVVCDGLLPWANHFLPPDASLAAQLRRFWEAGGVDHVSLTAGAGSEGPVEALAWLGFLRRKLVPHAARVREARDHAEAEAVKAAGCLSVSFHFQSATPFAPGLDLVDAFKDAGIVRAILAYNEANVFADGCHGPRNTGAEALASGAVDTWYATGTEIAMQFELIGQQGGVQVGPTIQSAPVWLAANKDTAGLPVDALRAAMSDLERFGAVEQAYHAYVPG